MREYTANNNWRHHISSFQQVSGKKAAVEGQANRFDERYLFVMNHRYGESATFSFQCMQVVVRIAFSQRYLRLIDERITKIVFDRLACDPDFDTYSVDSESSIGDSGFGLHDHTASIRKASTHDLSPMPVNATNNVITAENEIQIGVMKGRVEHLEKSREKLTEALNTIISKVMTKNSKRILLRVIGLTAGRQWNGNQHQKTIRRYLRGLAVASGPIWSRPTTTASISAFPQWWHAAAAASTFTLFIVVQRDSTSSTIVWRPDAPSTASTATR